MTESHDTTRARLEWLRELRDKALHAGSEPAVQKRREEGRLSRASGSRGSATRARSSSSTGTSATGSRTSG